MPCLFPLWMHAKVTIPRSLKRGGNVRKNVRNNKRNKDSNANGEEVHLLPSKRQTIPKFVFCTFDLTFLSCAKEAIFASGTGSITGQHVARFANLSAVGHSSTHTTETLSAIRFKHERAETGKIRTTRPASSPVYTTWGRARMQLMPAWMLAPLSRLLSV